MTATPEQIRKADEAQRVIERPLVATGPSLVEWSAARKRPFPTDSCWMYRMLEDLWLQS